MPTSSLPLGVTQWSLGLTGTECLSAAAALGFSTLHLDYGPPGTSGCLGRAWVREEFRVSAGRQGLKLAAIVINWLTESRSAEAADVARDIEEAVEAAARLGAELLVLPSFGAAEIRSDHALRAAAARLRFACEVADRMEGPLVATENTLDARGNERLLRLADHARARMLFDTQNPVLWGHDPLELIDALWPLFANHVHVKDGVDGVMGNRAPGDGTGQLRRTLDCLLDRGFAGVLVLESEPVADVLATLRRHRATLTDLVIQRQLS